MIGTPIDHCTNWVQLTQLRAIENPQQVLYTFLEGDHEQQLSCADLDRRARAIAARLQTMGEPGQRVLLLHPPGLAFIAAWYGCLYAGAIAVPTFPPRSARHARLMQRLAAVVADATPNVVLTEAGQLENIAACIGELDQDLSVLASDRIEEAGAAEWVAPELGGDEIACLQYTSGSTGHPKGVMLSHANLLANSAQIREAFGHDAQSVGVIWLPPYHDMGLIGGILQPLYAGFPVYLLSHQAFLKQPLRWLHAVSRYRATTSGGPNFAYEWCLERIDESERAELDLSSWRVAFNGAETVQAETLQRFGQMFSDCGFRPEAHYPCYGLAEASLIVAGGVHGELPIIEAFDATALVDGQVKSQSGDSSRSLVACGTTMAGASLKIIDGIARRPLPEDRIGEIWVHGPSVAKGYWGYQRPADDFAASLIEDPDTVFLRTGDLGFLHHGQLYVVGRMKDQLKVRGASYDPLDIEETTRGSHPAVTGAAAAAFTVPQDNQERPVIVHEIDRAYRHADLEPVLHNIRERVSEVHELVLHAVLLVPPGRIPRTPGGKLQRFAARRLYEQQQLQPLAEWHHADHQPAPAPSDKAPDAPDLETLQAWLVQRLAEVVELPEADIDASETFARYGLDSLAAVQLGLEIETYTGQRLPETVFLDYPSIAELSGFLSHANAGEAAAS